MLLTIKDILITAVLNKMWKGVSGLMKYGDTVITEPLESILESLTGIFHSLFRLKSKGHQAR